MLILVQEERVSSTGLLVQIALPAFPWLPSTLYSGFYVIFRGQERQVHRTHLSGKKLSYSSIRSFCFSKDITVAFSLSSFKNIDRGQ